MKILQVTRQYLPSVGGITTVVQQLSHQLQMRGHTVEVLALNHPFEDRGCILPKYEVLDGIVVHRIPYMGPSRYAVAPHVLRYIKAYDIVHIHSSDFFLDFLAFTKFWHRQPLVLTTHGLFFHTNFAYRLKQLYLRSVTRLALTQVEAVVCVSQADFALLQDVVPDTKRHYIPNGIDVAALTRLPLQGRDRNLIVTVGILSPRKRYDRLLHTMAQVVAKRPQTRLVIVGQDKGVLPQLMALREQLGLRDKVRFVTEASQSQLYEWLGRAAVWASASEYEGFGIALLEAMAAGCVPVVQPLATFKQLWGEGGFLAYADFDNHKEAAVTLIQQLERLEAERLLWQQQARNKSLEYGWQSVATQTETLYRLSQSLPCCELHVKSQN